MLKDGDYIEWNYAPKMIGRILGHSTLRPGYRVKWEDHKEPNDLYILGYEHHYCRKLTKKEKLKFILTGAL